MDQTISKSQALGAISQAMRDIEDAVRHHSPQTIELLERSMKAIRDRQIGTSEVAWIQGMSLTVEEWVTVRLYYSAASFMSAWFHLHGDSEKKDRASQSAALLIAGVGFDPLEVFREFVKYEQDWRHIMRQAGIGGKNAGCATFVVFLLLLFCAGIGMAGRVI
jgi:hypothetical protein